MATAVQRQRMASDRPWLQVSGVLVAIGVIAWIVQLSVGLDVLGAGTTVPWGLYIAAFFLLAGAGSGLVVLAAAGDLGVRPELKGQRRALLIGGLGCYVAAGFAILMDIGRPERALNMLFSPQFKSMFVWDFYSLALAVILTLVYLYKGAKSKGVVGLAATVATALVIVEGWILTVSAGSPLWHSALIPVVFVVEALLVAGSVVLMAKPKDEGELLRRALAALLAAAFVLSLVELVAVSYGGDVDAAAAMKLLVAGSFAPMYWGQMLIGVALPFVLLVWLSRNQGVVRVAAALAILGVLVAKTNLLVAGRAIPFMQPPGSYTPTVVEVAGLVGILGLAGFLYVFGQRVLKGGA